MSNRLKAETGKALDQRGSQRMAPAELPKVVFASVNGHATAAVMVAVERQVTAAKAPGA